MHSCVSPLIRLISTGIHKLLNTDVEDQEEERIRHPAVTIKIVSVTCFLLNLTGIQEFFQEFWAAYLKNLRIEKSISQSHLAVLRSTGLAMVPSRVVGILCPRGIYWQWNPVTSQFLLIPYTYQTSWLLGWRTMKIFLSVHIHFYK